MAGKYALIEVPDFDPDTSDMHSFLRLGAYPTDVTTMPGYDLAEKFLDAGGYFVDDTRDRGGPGGADAGNIHRTIDERKAETDRLFTRGGWWDHSDGNRISTTRGDKLEVIRGNYRLSVLGWQDNWGDGAGTEMSGGIIRNPQRTPGEIYREEWKTTWDGTWRVHDRTAKGDIRSTFWGNKEEKAYGDIFDSHVGSDAPDDETPNPEITSKTWAKSIKSYTGSATLPVLESYGETWALNAVDNTFLMTKTGTTMVLGAITETTMAANIISNDLYSTKMSIELGQAALSIGMLASKTDVSIVPNQIGVSVHASTLDFNATAIKTDIFAGNSVSAALGGSLSLMGGLAIDLAIAGKIGVTVGLAADIFAGATMAVRLGPALDVKTSAATEVTLGHNDETGTNYTKLGIKFNIN